MANEMRGEAELELNGAAFILKFDFNALAELEQALGGDSVTYILADAQRRAGIRFLRAAVYAGLKHDKALKGMTLEKIGKLLTGANIEEVALAVSKAMTGAFPPSDGAEGNPQGAAAESPSP